MNARVKNAIYKLWKGEREAEEIYKLTTTQVLVWLVVLDVGDAVVATHIGLLLLQKVEVIFICFV